MDKPLKDPSCLMNIGGVHRGYFHPFEMVYAIIPRSGDVWDVVAKTDEQGDTWTNVGGGPRPFLLAVAWALRQLEIMGRPNGEYYISIPDDLTLEAKAAKRRYAQEQASAKAIGIITQYFPSEA